MDSYQKPEVRAEVMVQPRREIVVDDYDIVRCHGIPISTDLLALFSDSANCGHEFRIVKIEGEVVTFERILQPYSIAESERRAIWRAMVAADYHKVRAAEMLGISKTTLYRKLKEMKAQG